MVIFSVGLPAPFTHWGDALVTALVRRAFGSASPVLAETLEDVGARVIASDEARFVVAMRRPHARLRSAVVDAGRPFVMFLDDPLRGALHLMSAHGATVADAVRSLGACCVAVMELPRAEHALVLHADHDGADPVATGSRIARHLGLPLSDGEIAEVAGQVDTDGLADNLQPIDTTAASRRTAERVSPLQAVYDGLSERDQAIVTDSLGPYGEVLRGSEVTRLVWPRDLFLIGDSANEAATREIDITGRSRCLLFGPYMHLFPGNWNARVVLGFSAETVGSTFIVEMVSGATVDRTTVCPDAGGVYDINLAFTLEGGDDPVEIRVFNERAAFDGRLAMGFVTLTRQATRHSRSLSATLDDRMLA